MFGSIFAGMKIKEIILVTIILHNGKGDIGGVMKICQICNLELLSTAAEDKNTQFNKFDNI